MALLELSESEHALNSPAVGARAPPKAYIFMPFSNYRRERVGSVTIAPTRNLEAGSLEEITITFMAGTFMAGDFGIDDTDAIKMSWHTASESSRRSRWTISLGTKGSGVQISPFRPNRLQYQCVKKTRAVLVVISATRPQEFATLNLQLLHYHATLRSWSPSSGEPRH
jgi:hypothetical protein